jgi:hypothetical protein
MRTIIVIALLFFIHGTCRSQEFNAHASLPIVEKDGFYRITLTSEVTPYINSEFSNIRILDNDNRELPYIFEVDAMKDAGSQFNEYQIEETSILQDSCTVIILTNPAQTAINNISLSIKNAAVSKEATLSGSDDRKTWYALKDRFQFGYAENPHGTTEIKIIAFPNSNYKYYRLVINDTKSPPLNVIKAGYYTSISQEARYIQVSPKTVTQSNDSKRKMSHVKITLDTPNFVDKVSWTISGIPYYLRRGSLYAERERINKKGKKETYLEFLLPVQLNSRQENVAFIPTAKAGSFLLEIENDDNPPLEISDLKLYQLNRHLTAWLKKDQSYLLKFGDNDMSPPVYDLAFFQDSISANLISLKPGTVSRKIIEATADQRRIFTTQSFIWGAIIIVIIFLGFMSVKMIRETNTAKK